MSRIVFTLALLSAVFLQAQPYSISTYAGGSPLAAPAANWDVSLTTDGAGNQYFSSYETVFKRDATGNWTRIAGNSRPGYSGDGGPAVDAELFEPWSVAVDRSGNVFIADLGNHRVRKVSTDGIINTVAGDGDYGFSGDGGPATSVGLSPIALAVDAAGNLFIAHAALGFGLNDGCCGGDNRVLRLSPDGMITTVAGGGSRWEDGVPAPSAILSTPSGIAVDSQGNLYIAEPLYGRIRKVSADGLISTVAGTRGVAEAKIGDKCAAGASGNGASATAAILCMPFSVAVDNAGNLFIGEFGYRCCYEYEDPILEDFIVRRVSPSGVITSVTSSHTPGVSGCDCADVAKASVALDSNGGVFFSDSLVSRKVSPDGTVTTLLDDASSHFTGDGGPAIQAQLWGPSGLALDAAGDLLIADTYNNRIRKISPGGVITTVAGTGEPGYSGDGGLATEARLKGVSGLAADAAGNLYIADRLNGRIRKVSPGGIITTVAGGGTDPSLDAGLATSAFLNYPTGLAVDGAGNLFIADATGAPYVPYNRVRKVSPDGIITTVAGGGTNSSLDGGPAALAELYGPTAVAVDAAGSLFIVDGPRLRKVSPDGIITTVAGVNTQLRSLLDVAVDSSGNLLLADGPRVSQVSPNGIITIIAGNGSYGYSGDHGPATRAELSANRLAADGKGNIYVSDSGHSVIRVLRPENSAGRRRTR